MLFPTVDWGSGTWPWAAGRGEQTESSGRGVLGRAGYVAHAMVERQATTSVDTQRPVQVGGAPKLRQLYCVVGAVSGRGERGRGSHCPMPMVENWKMRGGWWPRLPNGR